MAKVITFIGTNSGDGVTQIAQSVAEMIGTSGKRVLLLSASGYSGSDYLKKNTIGIDVLKNSLVSGVVKDREIKDIIVDMGNFDFLSGNENPCNYRYYQPENIDKICEVLSESYEYILIDAGFDVNQGMHIGALKKADVIYLIATQSKKGYERYKQKRENVYEKLEIDFMPNIVINKYLRSPLFFKEEEFEGLLKGKHILTIPFSEYGLSAEIEEGTLMKYKPIATKINELASIIMGENINSKKKKEKK